MKIQTEVKKEEKVINNGNVNKIDLVSVFFLDDLDEDDNTEKIIIKIKNHIQEEDFSAFIIKN